MQFLLIEKIFSNECEKLIQMELESVHLSVVGHPLVVMSRDDTS